MSAFTRIRGDVVKLLDLRAQAALATLMAKNKGLTPAKTEMAVLPILPLNTIKYTELLLGLSAPSVYELIKDGLLDARKMGKKERMTRITGESIKALIDSLPKGVVEGPLPEGPKYRRARKTSASLEEDTPNAA
jgi:hypothetical protein